ncbi:hypothetical protein ABTE25_20480, partial [Acinetobacter baumannii]
RTFKSNDLFEVKNKTLTRLWTIKSENHLILVSSKEIRTATVAELNAKRRLTSAEQALAEVSLIVNLSINLSTNRFRKFS